MSTDTPAVLFLHGQPGSAVDWERVRALLRPEVTAIAIDRPGWDRDGRARDLAGNVEAAVVALDRHSARRAVVVGHSLGAGVAVMLALTRPERVSALVLVAPAANSAAVYRLDRWLATPGLGELVAAATMGALGLGLSVPLLRRRVAARASLSESFLLSSRRAALSPRSWRAYAAEQRTLIKDLPALDDLMCEINLPTTILSGQRDRIVPPKAARILKRQIPGARLVETDGGHLLPQREPTLVAGAISEALDGYKHGQPAQLGMHPLTAF